LFYKVFKLFFVEQEKKWIDIIIQMRIKIDYYKALVKNVIQQKGKHLQKIERINDILFAKNPNIQNLEDHKLLITDLLSLVNEKRDQICLIESEKMLIEKEINFWVQGYDLIKTESIREKIKKMNIIEMKKNIDIEMAHKK
jgi:hypothetical protein